MSIEYIKPKMKNSKNNSLSIEKIFEVFHEHFATKYLDDTPWQFICIDKEGKFNLLSNIETSHHMRFALDSFLTQMSSRIPPEKEKVIEEYFSKIVLELTDEPEVMHD